MRLPPVEDGRAGPRPRTAFNYSPGITSASVQGRIALGRRAGARVWRLGYDPEAAWVASGGPRQAHLDGFDLHGNVWVPATNRARGTCQ